MTEDTYTSSRKGAQKAHRQHIGKRDNWTCGICHETIDPLLSPFESDWAATIDHIIPRCLGGRHSDDNLQIAHLRCNEIKGYDDKRAMGKLRREQRARIKQEQRSSRLQKREAQRDQAQARPVNPLMSWIPQATEHPLSNIVYNHSPAATDHKPTSARRASTTKAERRRAIEKLGRDANVAARRAMRQQRHA